MLNFLTGYVGIPLLEKHSKRKVLGKVADLIRFSNLTPEAQRQEQIQKLYEMLVFCSENVPYYQKLFRSVSFEPRAVLSDPQEIQAIPLLTKELVRQNWEGMKSPVAHHRRKTGGSTGQSAFFYYDQEGLDWTAAINLMALRMAKKFPHHSDSHISADLELLEIAPKGFKGKLMDWARLRAQNRTRLMVSSFEKHNLEKAYKQLKSERPYMLQGHPSSAFAIASYVLESRKSYWGSLISVFEPSGEMMTPKMVQTIEQGFKCKVVNRYGNAEFGVMAHSRWEDPWQKLEIFRRGFFIEPAQQQSVVVTGLTNFGFPLLRYDTGDVASVDTEGRFMTEIQGRVHDLIQINGESWPSHFIMDTLDHKIGGVRQFQIVRRKSGVPILSVVLEPEADQERVLKGVRGLWPEGLEVKFVKMEELFTTGWRQKFRHIIDEEVVNESRL
jgi:phenylacetate-CoA ligase